jgi:hypothetical protein
VAARSRHRDYMDRGDYGANEGITMQAIRRKLGAPDTQVCGASQMLLQHALGSTRALTYSVNVGYSDPHR